MIFTAKVDLVLLNEHASRRRELQLEVGAARGYEAAEEQEGRELHDDRGFLQRNSLKTGCSTTGE